MNRKEPLAEVVYFIDEDEGVIREMMFADFEALVDGLIAMPEFAGAVQRAVYVQINASFRIVACVLFRMAFDDEGHAPAQWHLPVEQLCSTAGKGPNLGAGPIKLSTSVQCSVPWHQSKLWDPQEVGDVFYWLKDAAKENNLGIDFNSISEAALEDHGMYGADDYFDEFDESGGSIIQAEESPFLQSDPSPNYPGQHGAMPGALGQHGHDMYRGYAPAPQPHMMPPMPYGYDASQYPPGYYPPPPGTVMPQHQHHGQSHPGQHHPGQHHPGQTHSGQTHLVPGHPSHGHPAQSHPGQSHPGQSHTGQGHPGQLHQGQSHPGLGADAIAQLQAQFQKKEQVYQQKLKQLVQKQQQELQQCKARYESRLLSVSKEYEQSMEEVSSELGRLRMKIENLLSQKDSLEDICAAQKAQIKSLGDKLEDFRQRSEDRQRESTEALSQKYEQTFEGRLRDMEAEYEDRLREKDAEIVYRQEVVKQLRKDITNMRRDKIRLVNSGGDKFLEKLDALGISFIAFHAGAGHISIPLSDMSTYMDNPVAYAASRCLVSEEAYRAWLEHHDNPVCRYVIEKDSNETCGCKVRKVDVPSEYREGITDRCEKHKSLTSDWENVVNING